MNTRIAIGCALALASGSALANPTAGITQLLGGGGAVGSLVGGNGLGLVGEEGLLLDGSELIEGVEPILAGSLSAQESDDSASGNLLVSDDGVLLGLDGSGDETINSDRRPLFGLLN